MQRDHRNLNVWLIVKAFFSTTYRQQITIYNLLKCQKKKTLLWLTITIPTFIVIDALLNKLLVFTASKNDYSVHYIVLKDELRMLAFSRWPGSLIIISFLIKEDAVNYRYSLLLLSFLGF